MLHTLSIHQKAQQTAVLKIAKDRFVSDQVGAAFFFGEIITEASDIGLENGRRLLGRYTDNAEIPLLITSDFENGCGSMLRGLTVLPYMMSLGAAGDEQLAYDYGKATALEARSVGANWTFSPVCDLNINPRNPLVNVRGLTDDPDLACRLLPSVIRGMQDHGLAACAKHFPGDGVDWRDQHIVTTNNSLSMEQWRKTSGRVFQAVIDAGVYSIMPGHITLPAYQTKEKNGMYLPATLSRELICDLLKGEMGFEGVVVTDALDMGGFGGWYPTREQAEIESFKAGCDMMLWPSEGYVDRLVAAVESGEVPMERLDDAVSRILRLKEKLGLFKRPSLRPLTDEDRAFVRGVQRRTADASITLLRDEIGLFPMSPQKTRRIAVVPVTHHGPAMQEAAYLCELLRSRGFEADEYPEGLGGANMDDYDLILYALFSRPFRPIGFLDFMGSEATKVWHALRTGVEKTAVVSFGSPYFAEQYFERALTCVNAYSMLSPSVEGFVRAACGDVPFTSFSPVRVCRFAFQR
ncbi:MAG: glycoside hydrolase family 3 protein [Clostridia bacterium]|nr:glycoside hydrolase family 3 protein [Clostridia bacterium]